MKVLGPGFSASVMQENFDLDALSNFVIHAYAVLRRHQIILVFAMTANLRPRLSALLRAWLHLAPHVATRATAHFEWTDSARRWFQGDFSSKYLALSDAARESGLTYWKARTYCRRHR